MALSISFSTTTDSISASVSTSGLVAMQINWYLDGTLDGSDNLAVGDTSSSWTFTGLEEDTSYNIRAVAYQYNPWQQLDSGSTTAKTKSSAVYYYLKLILDGNGGKLSSGSTTITFTGSAKNTTEVNLPFDGSGFTRSGYTLLGFNASPSDTSILYGPTGTFVYYAESTSASNPTTVRMYAVWEEEKTRPANWAWTSTVRKGAAVPTVKKSATLWHAKYLTATEWNNFQDRVAAFLKYKGVSFSGSFTRVSAGATMQRSTINGIIQAIALMDPPTSPPAEVGAGQQITAATFIRLRDSLNSIQ